MSVSDATVPLEMILIKQLNNLYTLALDALVPDAARVWAETFVADGRAAVADWDGSVIDTATGRDELLKLYYRFPAIETTRHRIDNPIIAVQGNFATMTAYCTALNIAASPAIIERTGVYRDRLSKVGGDWKFIERILTLDPASSITMGTPNG